MSQSQLCFASAGELARRIRTREISAAEVLRAHLDQIDRLNPQLNALVTLVDRPALLRAAEAADRAVAAGDRLGPLHGLPVAHKDLIPTRGLRTTYGSRVFADNVPTQDGLIVERLRAAGAITVGKTNTPEFGAGSQTVNAVFGATLNPWDTSKTCGGSSGGAAVAVATGMLPIADGTDLGGSLRNPGNFNNVVGFRPSSGRVPVWPRLDAWFTLSVQGVLARSTADVALGLSAIAGPDARAPLAIDEPGSIFQQPLERDFRGVRIAWSENLGGLPVDPRVTQVLESQRHVLSDLGCAVEAADPDLREADDAFRVWRAWFFELSYGQQLAEHRDILDDNVVWNIEEGRKLTSADLGRAALERTRVHHRMREFLDRYDFLVCPVNQVPPFDVRERWVHEIAGTRMDTYIDWMRSCYWISVTELPAISVPCGFTPEGLPVGIQIVGRHHADVAVLQLAHAFEQATRFGERRPPIAADR
ncbi:MAG: amidase [Candidatus Binatia bacterium]